MTKATIGGKEYPAMVNRYATFVTDIEPKGFDVVAIDGHLTRETIQMVRSSTLVG